MNNMFELLNIQTLSQVHRFCGGSHSSASAAVHSTGWLDTLPLFIQLKPIDKIHLSASWYGEERQWKVRCRHCCSSYAGIAVCSPGPLTLILSAVPRVMVLLHFARPTQATKIVTL